MGRWLHLFCSGSLSPNQGESDWRQEIDSIWTIAFGLSQQHAHEFAGGKGDGDER